MSLDYETFRQHQERYEKEKADQADAQKWRDEQAKRKASRDHEPDHDAEPVRADDDHEPVV